MPAACICCALLHCVVYLPSALFVVTFYLSHFTFNYTLIRITISSYHRFSGLFRLSRFLTHSHIYSFTLLFLTFTSTLTCLSASIQYLHPPFFILYPFAGSWQPIFSSLNCWQLFCLTSPFTHSLCLYLCLSYLHHKFLKFFLIWSNPESFLICC